MVVLRLTDETIHHKDAIVDTDAEDECRDDDIDQIKLHAEDVHGTEDNKPTQHYRHGVRYVSASRASCEGLQSL